jgi:hypothetical protein
MVAPKYLTGDKASIDEFIDQFDVSRPLKLAKKQQSDCIPGVPL